MVFIKSTIYSIYDIVSLTDSSIDLIHLPLLLMLKKC